MPSVVVPVFASFPPRYGVLLLDWAVVPVVFLFRPANVVIGLRHIARMLVARAGDGASWIFKVIMIPLRDAEEAT